MSEMLQRPHTVVKVLGLGGGGSNTVARMIEFGVQGVEFIAANTDAQVLRTHPASRKVLLGPRTTGGRGAGGRPEIGYKAAEESRDELAAALEGADMVFLTAGMGGGTGTGAIPVAAEIARAQGAVTVSVVTTPFAFEGTRRSKHAVAGLTALREHTDTLVVVPNERLLAVAPRNLTLDAAFRLADEVLRRAIQGITDVITQTGVINRDFNDIRRMMARGGGALISLGNGKGENRVQDALHAALHNPLLGDISIGTATGVLANFVGGEDLALWEVVGAMEALHQRLPESADVVWGFNSNPNFADRVQVMLLITGVGGLPVAGPRVAATAQANAHSRDRQAVSAFGEEMNANLDMPAFLRRRLHATAR